MLYHPWWSRFLVQWCVHKLVHVETCVVAGSVVGVRVPSRRIVSVPENTKKSTMVNIDVARLAPKASGSHFALICKS